MSVGFLSPNALAQGLKLITTSSFTGSSAVNINSVFSDTYQNYKIFVTVTSATANGNLQFRLRSSGTDSTTNYSFWNFEPSSNSSTVYTNISASANSYYCGYSTAGGGIFELNISRPFETSSSYFTHIYASYNTNIPATTLGSGGGHNSNSTSYDGCTIFPVSGTITGNVRIFGVQN